MKKIVTICCGLSIVLALYFEQRGNRISKQWDEVIKNTPVNVEPVVGSEMELVDVSFPLVNSPARVKGSSDMSLVSSTEGIHPEVGNEMDLEDQVTMDNWEKLEEGRKYSDPPLVFTILSAEMLREMSSEQITALVSNVSLVKHQQLARETALAKQKK